MAADDAVTLWLEAAGRQVIPGYEEQLRLGRLIQRAQQADATDRDRRRGQRALDRLVAGNLRLVAPVARKYRRALDGHGCSLTLADLLQEGAVGLLIAARKFDPTRGYRFSTMAYWWISQSIQRLVQTQRGMIRVPISQQDIVRRWARRPEGQTAEEWCQEWERYGYTPESLAEALRRYSAVVSVGSLDRRVQDFDDSSTLGELVADQVNDAERLFEQMDLEQEVETLRAIDPDGLALVELHHVEGVRMADLAELEGCSRQVASNRVIAARNRLAAGEAVKVKHAPRLEASKVLGHGVTAVTVTLPLQVAAEQGSAPASLQERMQRSWLEHCASVRTKQRYKQQVA